MKSLTFTPVLITCLALFGCRRNDDNIPNKIYPADPPFPIVTTQLVNNVTMTSAVCEGSATVFSGKPLITDFGILYGLSLNPDIKARGTSIVNGNFSCAISDLLPDTKYYFEAYATNSAGTQYGLVQDFVTISTLPSVFTTYVHDFTNSSALLGGYVLFEGESSVSERGVYWGTVSSPEISGKKIFIGNGLGSYSTSVIDLLPNTDYFVKAYAINSRGTKFGIQYKFNTGLSYYLPVIKDIENNSYHFVTIGTQIWMVENLRTTKFNDNTLIAKETTSNWDNLTTPAYCWPENDTSYKQDFGAVYNWYAISSNKICPVGWHVSTDADWNVLMNSLGGNNIAGNKLRETGSLHWQYPNYDATNETGFNALPSSGIKKTYGFWWALENDLTNAWGREMKYSDSWVYKELVYPKSNGRLFVRCVKNN